MATLRGLISVAIAALMVVEVAMGLNHTVGGSNGWDTSTNLQSWVASQSFSVGDNLIFQYSGIHSVVEVNKADYDSCQTNNAIQIQSGGNTIIPLSSPGKRYFICGTSGHCGLGMKIEIDTLASAPPPASPVIPPPTSPPPTTPVVSPPPTSPVVPPPTFPPPPPSIPPSTPSPTLPPSKSPPSPKSAPSKSPSLAPSKSPSSRPTPTSSPTISTKPPPVALSGSPSSSPSPSSSTPPSPSSANKDNLHVNPTIGFGIGMIMMLLAL